MRLIRIQQTAIAESTREAEGWLVQINVFSLVFEFTVAWVVRRYDG